jgi:hypothetical protein
MRRVEVFEYANRVRSSIGTGDFVQYGISYEDFENGPGMYTTAIVEMNDGTVKNVYVENIRFLDKDKDTGEESK